MKKEINYILAVCLIFGMYFVVNRTLFSTIYHSLNNTTSLSTISFFVTYIAIGIPVIIFVYFTNNKTLLEPFGLERRVFYGLAFAFIFTVPMFLGYGYLSDFSIQIDSRTFWFGCVFAAFFEEFYYRGFFFGQLFRKTKLGFFLSLIISAIIFASLHMYQSTDVGTLVGIFITTFMGAGLFAWLYVEWDYNLWVSIGLHFFMNLSWEMFSIADNAFGGWEANLIRMATILLAVVGTIYYKIKLNKPLAINRETLFPKYWRTGLQK